MLPASRLTCTVLTPGTADTLFSTCAEQAAQLIPPTRKRCFISVISFLFPRKSSMGKGFALLPLPREGVFVILSIRHGLRVVKRKFALANALCS